MSRIIVRVRSDTEFLPRLNRFRHGSALHFVSHGLPGHDILQPSGDRRQLAGEVYQLSVMVYPATFYTGLDDLTCER
jgi:hypothetical protein